MPQEVKWKYVGQHCTSDWKSLGRSSGQQNFESVRGCKHAALAVILIRGRRQWRRGFYSNTVSLALKLKAFYLQLQILLDLILSCLEISPLSCTHFPACNLTSPWYLCYLSVVLHNVSRWKFSLKSDLSLCSLEFQIVLPSSVGKEYHGQNTYVIKPGFDLSPLTWDPSNGIMIFCCSFLHRFLTIYTLQLHVAAFLLLIRVKSVSAAVKLIYSLLRQLISMTSKLPAVSEWINSPTHTA